VGDLFIKQAAEQIAASFVHQAWWVIGLSIAITGVCSYFAASWGAYARKRGETLATKADFAELAKQLAATTRLAEEVKLAVAHDDWVTREWKTLRRVKLEELCTAIASADNWLKTEQQRLTVFQGIVSSSASMAPSPEPQIRQLIALYFPEMAGPVNLFLNRLLKMHIAMLDSWPVLASHPINSEAWQTANNQRTAKWSENYPHLLDEIGAIESKAAALLVKIMGNSNADVNTQSKALPQSQRK